MEKKLETPIMDNQNMETRKIPYNAIRRLVSIGTLHLSQNCPQL